MISVFNDLLIQYNKAPLRTLHVCGFNECVFMHIKQTIDAIMVKSAIHGEAAVNVSAPARLCPGRRVAYEAFKLQILCIKGPER